jgi:hypothetical protein
MGNPLPRPIPDGYGSGWGFLPMGTGTGKKIYPLPMSGRAWYALPALYPPHCHPYHCIILKKNPIIKHLSNCWAGLKLTYFMLWAVLNGQPSCLSPSRHAKRDTQKVRSGVLVSASWARERKACAHSPHTHRSAYRAGENWKEGKIATPLLRCLRSRLVWAWATAKPASSRKTLARAARRRQWRPRPATGSPSSRPGPEATPPIQPLPPCSLAAPPLNAAPPTVTIPSPIPSPSLPPRRRGRGRRWRTASSPWTPTGCAARPCLSPASPSPAPAIPTGCLVSWAGAGDARVSWFSAWLITWFRVCCLWIYFVYLFSIVFRAAH